MGARSAGNPHAACDVEGTGNVARSSGLLARQSSTLPMTQAGEPGTARVASRRSPQENRETSGSTQAPGEQSAPAASPSRLLIATGLGITAFTLYLMTGFTSDVSQGTLVRTGLLHGFGIGFVFVRLRTVAFGTLPPALRTQGTGLFNLMRNIGASIGISMMGYLLVRNPAVTQAAPREPGTPLRPVRRDHAPDPNV